MAVIKDDAHSVGATSIMLQPELMSVVVPKVGPLAVHGFTEIPQHLSVHWGIHGFSLWNKFSVNDPLRVPEHNERDFPNRQLLAHL